jgi:hypothetical protein
MALRGLREKMVYIHNPLPLVSDLELLKRADLEFIEGSERPFLFSWTWKYDTGPNFEQLRVAPGEFSPLREAEAHGFIAEFGEQGAVAVEDPEDADEVLKAKLKGLNAARKFWLDRGTRRAQAYRKVQGIGKEELEEQKSDLWPYYRNQAAAEVCDEEMKRLKDGGVVVTPRAKKRAAAK